MEDKNSQFSNHQYWDPNQADSIESEQDREAKLLRQRNKMRHRLIGGTVVISTLLITLPMLFSEPSIRTSQQAKTTIPNVPGEPFGKLEFSVKSDETYQKLSEQVPLKDLSQPNEVDENKREIVTTPPKQEVIQEEASKASPTIHQESPQVKKTENLVSGNHFFIQVLATSSEQGAMREMARYQAAGLPVYSVKMQKKSATIWRVRLGPFNSKVEADKVVLYLDAQKIQHMPVQLEKTETEHVTKMTTTPSLKSVTHQVQKDSHSERKGSTQPTDVKPPKVKVIESKKPTQHDAAQAKGLTNLSKEKAVESKKMPQPVKIEPKVSSDPLADALKSVRQTDLIAEQIAKERAAQQRNNK